MQIVYIPSESMSVQGKKDEIYKRYGKDWCEFPYKSRVMPTSEPLKTLKAPYMARNTMKWGFFRLKSQ